MKRSILVLCSLILFLPQEAAAGGFLIYEHGASATGMANARTALSDDVNALYFNPAAITELEGLQVQLGMTAILPFISYEAQGALDSPRTYNRISGETVVVNDGLNDASISGFFPPYHAYISYNIPDTGVVVGFAANNPFGLGTTWPDDWDGRFIAIETEIQTFFFQPVVAVDIAKLAGFDEHFKLSLAAGYNFVYGRASLAKGIDLRVAERFFAGIENPEGKLEMKGDGFGHGWNAALFAQVPRLLAFGFSFRSPVSIEFEGDASFSFNQAGEEAIERLNSLNPVVFPTKTTGSVEIEMPMNMNVGVAFLGVERLTIAADFYYAFFSSYKELAVRFSCVNDDPACTLDEPPIEKNWNDSWQASLGAEYKIADVLPLRLGYGYVSQAVPEETYDPSLPDGGRQLLTAGIGYEHDWFDVDLGYMLAIWSGEKKNDVGGEDDNLNPNGKANGAYDTVTHLIALSLSASF
ncbi:MAG: outer membrane protein transport protein [Myxococcota bacterium]|jgi:long-chain fatty acid transport protein|nr:outer membrane protein transport protein [Myxococcota bacterium]